MSKKCPVWCRMLLFFLHEQYRKTDNWYVFASSQFSGDYHFLSTGISIGTSSGFRSCKDIFMSHDLRAHHQEDLSVNAEEQRGNLPVLEEHPWLGSPPFMSWLVVSTHLLEKYSSNWTYWTSSPNRGENKQYLKPPPSEPKKRHLEGVPQPQELETCQTTIVLNHV